MNQRRIFILSIPGNETFCRDLAKTITGWGHDARISCDYETPHFQTDVIICGATGIPSISFGGIPENNQDVKLYILSLYPATEYPIISCTLQDAVYIKEILEKGFIETWDEPA